MDKLDILIPEFKQFASSETNQLWENHVVYRFSNNYGASIVKEEYHSELMLIFFPSTDANYILFGKPINNLTTEKTKMLLANIKNNKKY